MKIGTYYYPEQWPREQWQRDFDNIAKMGLQIVHMAEFAWFTLEPRPGEFHFDWLHECVEMARQRKLDVILCTPTAAPPVWLSRGEPSTLPVDRHGTPCRFGGRRHYNPCSSKFREACARIVEAMAREFGDDPSTIGWQIDNELGGAFDQSGETHAAFQSWLQRKYGTVEQLNRAWGNQFWNQYYTDFSQIRFPFNRNPEYRNPHESLDASRFWSWAWADFTKLQADILKRYVGERFITTNFMPLFPDCDPKDFEGILNFWSWDSYPVTGWDRNPTDENFRIADPAGIALVHDQMASFNGRWGLMEVQPGQVNWSGVPCRLYPGTVRLFLWSAFAHGAEFITVYRFRRPRFGIELWHDALVGPDGVTPTEGGQQFMQVIREVGQLQGTEAQRHEGTKRSDPCVGIVLDFDQLWLLESVPQAKRFSGKEWVTRWYAAAMRLGLPIRVVHADRDIPADVTLLIAPSIQMVDDALLKRWRAFAEHNQLILTCRTGIMDRSAQLFECEYGGAIRELIGARIDAYDSLPVDAVGHIQVNKERYKWGGWGEQLLADTGTEVLGKFTDQFYSGAAAVTHRRHGTGGVTYCGVDGELALLEALTLAAAERAGLGITPVPRRTQLLRRDGAWVFVNYNDRPVEAPAPKAARFIVGQRKVTPAGVAVWLA